MSQHTVLILVTHLLGSGHLSRALTLARAFSDAGHKAHVVSGGMPAPQLNAKGVDLVQLPPLRSDGTDFTRLLDETGTLADPAQYAARLRALRAAYDRIRPDIVITELFPFGRRSLRAEFRALLETCHAQTPRPRVFASVRDILAPPSKPAKAAFAAELIDTLYDGVLVHSDPTLVPLELSWPVSDAMRTKLRYTGFVAPPLPPVMQTGDGMGEVLVSAGGGSVGAGLYRSALIAAAQDTRPWRMLVAGHDAAAQITALQAEAPGNVTIEPARPDFRALLQRADLSLSLCGYNTAMDVLQTGTPALLVAFDDGGEVEQTLRAQALAAREGIETLALNGLTGAQVAAAVQRLRDAPRTPAPRDMFDGAARSVQICIKEVLHDS